MCRSGQSGGVPLEFDRPHAGSMGGVGKLLIISGVVLVAAGLIVLAVGRIPSFGRLPGDITIRRDGLTVYFPLVTCLLLSGALSLLLYLLRR